jgi:nucleotide-binding universal stress UspA family protein
MTSEQATNAVSTIVCGTDGSADAHRAVDYVARLARQLDAAVVLVHAIGLLEHLPKDPTGTSLPSDLNIGEWATAQLSSEWSAPLRDCGVSHECVAEDGPPLLVLPRIVERVDADLLVIASHGRGAASALPLGSTAHGLVQLAPCPVLVVPRDHETSANA